MVAKMASLTRVGFGWARPCCTSGGLAWLAGVSASICAVSSQATPLEPRSLTAHRTSDRASEYNPGHPCGTGAHSLDYTRLQLWEDLHNLMQHAAVTTSSRWPGGECWERPVWLLVIKATCLTYGRTRPLQWIRRQKVPASSSSSRVCGPARGRQPDVDCSGCPRGRCRYAWIPVHRTLPRCFWMWLAMRCCLICLICGRNRHKSQYTRA